MKKKQPVIFTK